MGLFKEIFNVFIKHLRELSDVTIKRRAVLSDAYLSHLYYVDILKCKIYNMMERCYHSQRFYKTLLMINFQPYFIV